MPLPIFATGQPLTADDANTLARQGVITVPTTAARDDLPAPHAGMIVFVEADSTYYARVGGAWAVFWADTGWVDCTPGALAGTYQVRKVGRLVEARWRCTGAIAADTLVSPLFTVPLGFRPAGPGVAAAVYGASGYPMTAVILGTGIAYVRNNRAASIADNYGSATYFVD